MLAGPVEAPAAALGETEPGRVAAPAGAELQALRAEVAQLRGLVEHLYAELGVARRPADD